MAERFYNTQSNPRRENYKGSNNLGDRNRSLDGPNILSEQEMFDKYYKSQSGPNQDSPSRLNYQTYPYDYFTGTNAQVFFGDVWVDDIINISYSASQTKEPIFGYASQTFDAVARGIVSVQGSFAVAFKEMGYLNIIHRLLEKQRQGASAALDHKLDEIQEKAKAGKARYEPRLASDQFTGRFGFSPTGSAQIIRQQDTIEDILMYKKGGNIIASGLGASTIQSPKANRDFEDFAELMEDTIWGDSNGNPLNREFKFRRADEFDYRYDARGRDIGGIVTSKTKTGDDYSRVLNIMLSFGDLTDVRAEHTLVVLNDVHILGESMVVSPTGDPIAVMYNFFARNINENITRNLAANINPIKFSIGVDYEVSKIDDVEAVEEFLDLRKGPSILNINGLSKFDQVNGWQRDNRFLARIQANFTRNPYEPFVDQTIRQVEAALNDVTTAGTFSDLTKEQWVIEVRFEDATGAQVQNPLTMIVQQKIPNTHTYRVISPTRQNFRAPQIFTRDDLWATIPPPQDPGEAELKAKTNSATGDTATVSADQGTLYTTDAFGNKIQVPLDSIGTPITVQGEEGVGPTQFEREQQVIAQARADELGLTGIDRDIFLAEAELEALEQQDRTASARQENTNQRDQQQQDVTQQEGQSSGSVQETLEKQGQTAPLAEDITPDASTKSIKETAEKEEAISDEEIAQQIDLLRKAAGEGTNKLGQVAAISELTDESKVTVAWKALFDEDVKKLRELAEDPDANAAALELLDQVEKYSSQEQGLTDDQFANLVRTANQNEQIQTLIREVSPEIGEFVTGENAQNALKEYTTQRQQILEEGREFTRRAEGSVNEVYNDTEKKQTIGTGFNIDPEEPTAADTVQRSLGVSRTEAENIVASWRAGTPITEEQQEKIFLTQYETAQRETRQLIPNINELSPQTEAALTDLVFNVGLPRAQTFERTIEAARAGDEDRVRQELINSQREQQTKGRTQDLYNELDGTIDLSAFGL